jgi:hypothetical protein
MRPPERRECRPPGLVRKRDGDLRASGERFEQGPLGPGQILETVREDRLTVPRREIARDTFGGVAAEQLAIPEP